MCFNCAPAPRNAPTAHTDATLPNEKHKPNFAGARTSVGRPRKKASAYMNADVALNAKNHATRSAFSDPSACVVCAIVSDAERANDCVDVCAAADALRARATPCVVSVSNCVPASRANDSQSLANDDCVAFGDVPRAFDAMTRSKTHDPPSSRARIDDGPRARARSVVDRESTSPSRILSSHRLARARRRMSTPDRARARRVTSLLSSYYDGDDSVDADASTVRHRRHHGERIHDDGFVDRAAPSTSRASSACSIDLDSPLFSARAFVDDLSRRGDAEALRDAYARLSRSSRDVDSRAQMLVYDNYGKFVRAASAVRDLRGASEKMRGTCDALRERVRVARALSERTSARLSARRDAAERLRGVRGLIGRLSAGLRAAPGLESVVKGEVRGEEARAVVGEYVEAREALEATGNDDAEARSETFARAKRRCDAAMEVIVDRLKARARVSAIGEEGGEETTETMDAFGLSDEACVELLAALRVSQDELVDDFLASRLAKLGNALGRARASNVSSDVHEFVVALDRDYLAEFSDTLDAFGKLFADVDGARSSLVRFTKDAFGEYFALIREKCVSEEEEEEGKEEARDERVLLDPRRLMSAMGAMAADLASAHRAVPEASLGDRAVETIERAVRGRTDAAFVRLERALVREIDATREEARRVSERSAAAAADDGDGSTNKSLLQRFIATSDALLTSVQTILTDVRALVDERPILLSGWRDEFAQSVRGRFLSLTHALASRLIAGCPIAPQPAPEPTPLATPLAVAAKEARESAELSPPPSSFILVCARLCAFLGESATPHVVDALAATFPASTAASDDGGLDDARVMCASARDVLLRWYVEQSAQSIGFMIRKSLTAADWAKTREPRDVRPLADYVADRLSIVERECAQILDVGDAAEDAAEDDDGRVSATQTSVARAVVERAVKSYVECVRCQTFPTKFAFQQIALDVRYFAEHALPPFMPVAQFTSDGRERRRIDAALAELRSACVERAADPTPMDDAIADRILQRAKKTNR